MYSSGYGMPMTGYVMQPGYAPTMTVAPGMVPPPIVQPQPIMGPPIMGAPVMAPGVMPVYQNFGPNACSTVGMDINQKRTFYASLLANPISAQQYIENVFYTIDTNRTGSISYWEFENAFYTNPELQQLLTCGFDLRGTITKFRQADLNRDGRISMGEFYNMMYRKMSDFVNGVGCFIF